MTKEDMIKEFESYTTEQKTALFAYFCLTDDKFNEVAKEVVYKKLYKELSKED